MRLLSEQLRATEVDDLSDRMILLFKQNPVKDSHLQEFFAEMQVISDEITRTINGDRVMSTLKAKNTVRNSKITALNFIIKGYTYSPLKEISEPANEINKIFSKYGMEIKKLNYSESSSLVESLLMDFADENVKQQMGNLLGLDEAVEELRLAQTDFTETRVQYELNLSQEKQLKTATDVKKELLNLINNKIAVYLSAMAMADANKYANLDNVLDKFVSDMNDMAKRRRKTKSDETSDEIVQE